MGEVVKIFAVSDVHGHCSLLKEALNAAGYDKENPRHLLVCCGDYFDRGNENYEVLKFFEQQKNCVKIKGNHEEMLKKLFDTGKMLPHHYINGTHQTILDFFGKYAIDPENGTVDFSGKTSMLDRVSEFIDETVNFFETENYCFVHGWVPDSGSLSADWRSANDEQWSKARWVKWNEQYKHSAKPVNDKILVCGHVPTLYAYTYDDKRTPDDSDIFYGDGIIAIDAGTFTSQRVNVLVVEDKLI